MQDYNNQIQKIDRLKKQYLDRKSQEPNKKSRSLEKKHSDYNLPYSSDQIQVRVVKHSRGDSSKIREIQ